MLIIIQTIEAGTPNSLQHSSYGYYYDYLITKGLGSAGIPQKDVDAYMNLLACVGYELFKVRRSTITEENLCKFHKKYVQDYDVTDRLSYDKVFPKILQSGIVVQEGESCYFRYKYLFYYFVAKYFASNINSPEIRATVEDLSLKVYKEENGNILMFLIHLSRDQFIIDQILSKARENFESVEEVALDDDVSVINALIRELPKLVIDNIDANVEKEKMLKKMDQIENENGASAGLSPNGKEVYKEDNQDNLLEFITKLNTAFKSIELLGQILKSYHGSLRSEVKQDLCNEAYSICLRTLNSYFISLKDGLDNLVPELAKIFDEEGVNSKEKATAKSREVIFSLSLIISCVFIRRLAFSVGSEDLTATFDKVLSNNSTIARRIVDLSIKLGYSRQLPEEAIVTLDQSTRKLHLSNMIIKEFVIEFLYMYDIDLSKRQSICDRIGIKHKFQQELEYKKAGSGLLQ